MPSTKSLRDTKLYLAADDDFVEVKVGEGNITWTEGQTVEYVTNRGRIGSADGGRAKLTDDVPMEVSFDIIFEYYSDKGSPLNYDSPIEYFHEMGDSPEPCGPSAVDIVIELEDPCDDGNEEFLIFKRFMYTSLNYDLEAGTISATGECLAIEPIRTTTKPSLITEE